jgi:hypothetical protein
VKYGGQSSIFDKKLPTAVPVFAGDIKPGTAYYFNGQKFSGFEFMNANGTMSPENQNIFTGVTASGSTTGNTM